MHNLRRIEEKYGINTESESFYLHGARVPNEPGSPHYRGLRSHSGTPDSLGLRWTSDYTEAETYT